MRKKLPVENMLSTSTPWIQVCALECIKKRERLFLGSFGPGALRFARFEANYSASREANATVACFVSHVMLLEEIAQNFSDDRAMVVSSVFVAVFFFLSDPIMELVSESWVFVA